MTNEELNTELYKKLFAEQEKFKGWLLTQPPSEILNHAYEYVMREDIVPLRDRRSQDGKIQGCAVAYAGLKEFAFAPRLHRSHGSR